MITECACLCAPAGHDYLICGHTAQPGMSVRLVGALDFPVCRPCYDALTAGDSRPAEPQRAARVRPRPHAGAAGRP